MIMAVIQIIWIMKDCYNVQSTVGMQLLRFTAWRYAVYLGIKSWLQVHISVYFQKVT